MFAGTAVLAALLVLARSGRAGAKVSDEQVATPVISLQLLASGLGSVTSITTAGPSDTRLFITTQAGQIRIYNGSFLLPSPFLDLAGNITCCGERGLLSVAFHPNYALNHFLFVYYTNRAGDIEIARVERSASNPDFADPSKRTVLLTIDHHTFPNSNTNHNGGQLQFGPDGYLYFGTGDGGSANDPPCNAQNDNAALGKLLRIDVNVAFPPFYGIPATNPHFIDGNVTDPFQLTWAKGLRNPWRFSFDAMTGDLWIGDVGQDNYEEIDHQLQSSLGGENYGWKIKEGNHCTGNSGGCAPPVPLCSASFTDPVFEYDHFSDGRCAVTGGYVYRGSQDPALFGTYLYGDYCSGQIWSSGQLLAPIVPQLQTFGQDAAGELYIGTGNGQLYRIIHSAPTPTPTPTPTQTPTAPPTVTPTPTPPGLRPGFPLSGRHHPVPVELTPRQPA